MDRSDFFEPGFLFLERVVPIYKRFTLSYSCANGGCQRLKNPKVANILLRIVSSYAIMRNEIQ